MIVHELEEKIMNVWGTADDLDAVLHWIDGLALGIIPVLQKENI